MQVPCDCLVLTAGPWLGSLATSLLGDRADRADDSLDITGSQANSIILRPRNGQSKDLGANAVFARIQMGGPPSENEPEVYCRPDGTVYL